MIALSLLLAARLIQLQWVQHDFYLRCALRQWERKVSLPGSRGNLYDRSGSPLAVSAHKIRISTDPSWFVDMEGERKKRILGLLSRILDRKESLLRRQLKKNGHFLLLDDGRQLTSEEREALEETGLFRLEEQTKRLYPLGSIAAPLIGFLNSEGNGAGGLEASLQEFLAGEPGLARVQKDGRGRSSKSSSKIVVKPAVPGGDVTLTIDHKMQAIVDGELKRAVEDASAKSGAAVVLEPSTGHLLALSSWPSPESRDDAYRAVEWQLLPLQASYEPGSTVKALSSVALMEKGGVDFQTQTDAEDGTALIDGFAIRDDKEHFGFLSFREAFSLSSNVCFAKLSERVSDQELFSTLRDFGFGIRSGLEYPGEQDGILRHPTEWSRRSRLTLVFGQEMSATPLQMVSAFAALANEGRLMKPQLILARAKSGRPAEKVEELSIRKVCRESTARKILELCEEVVLEGTGTRAAAAPFRVGGKTGTAQKFEQGKLKSGKYMASFIGMIPLEKPSLVIGVFLDEPRYGKHHGGVSAAPAFARIARRAALSTDWLALPEIEEDEKGNPGGFRLASYLDLEAEEAQRLAVKAGVPVLLRGRGERVVAQEPAPGALLPPDENLNLILGGEKRKPGEPPRLKGCTLREARKRALERGYQIEARGQGIVIRQEAPRDRKIIVKLGEP
ncbi:MAG: penicillin-binding transpeptidase domain-containing protein [Candidatus Krumholzibacteria bacterium]|nr:penicillin-binding transpeptidase domain-containing protein [Candidatus Krumholzibacteria bacterium]MDP6669425.1 penicillin-binding transpeptidase domain-containing protein [Candidatus Krumholzibacteria bacterium]MDP6797879.1 penicillin-binding transpeptidase domain-containing protein [Candidatus Krumholzibacteria bacterium]MDP7021622.1 penicillin-binding transpeptidase domain-containing protein [Candidatus Krumholzibacteria bacterium]